MALTEGAVDRSHNPSLMSLEKKRVNSTTLLTLVNEDFLLIEQESFYRIMYNVITCLVFPRRKLRCFLSGTAEYDAECQR